ncbi:MAG: hypothetical protein Q4Q22_08645, partial [Methanosphaera sp.]|nr:hypothetical protein [Methanosphaera sp.]
INIIEKIPNLNAGNYTITVKYEDNEGKYENKTININLLILDTLYASPDVSDIQEGTIDNPTNIYDAFNRLCNDMTLYLLKTDNDNYLINNFMNIQVNNTKIIGENITIDAQYKCKILNITGNNNSIINITFANANYTTTTTTSYGSGGAISTQGSLSLYNVNCYNCSVQNTASTGVNGGAISANTLYINNVTCYNNSATSRGGAISSNTIIINGTNNFINNTAKEGGAIYGLNISINGTNNFINNTAWKGGAIYLQGQSIQIPRPPFFINTLSELKINGQTTFTSNKASQKGGDIYHERGILNINNTIFNLSQAPANAGGSIYSQAYDNNVQIQNSQFINVTGETLYIQNTKNNIANNTYLNCTINLKTFNITSPQADNTQDTNTPITINTQITLSNPQYDDNDILDNLKYQIFINDINKINTTENEYTFTIEEYGTLNIHIANEKFKQTTNNIIITQTKKDIIITNTPSTIGDTTNITATITVNDETLTNLSAGKITFKVNGKTLKDDNGKVIYAKVVNGTATIENFLVPDTWNKYSTIQAIYTGSTDLAKITSEKTEITINTPETTITTTDVTATAGQTVTLTATINTDLTINTGKVVFKINGKSIKDANGKVIYAKVANNQVSVEYTIPTDMKAKDYQLTAVFISPEYERLEDTKTLTITA